MSSAHLLKSGKAINGFHQADVTIEVGLCFGAVVPTTHDHRPIAQHRQRLHASAKHRPQLRLIRCAVRTQEASRGEHAGDEEHVELAGMVSTKFASSTRASLPATLCTTRPWPRTPWLAGSPAAATSEPRKPLGRRLPLHNNSSPCRAVVPHGQWE